MGVCTVLIIPGKHETMEALSRVEKIYTTSTIVLHARVGYATVTLKHPAFTPDGHRILSVHFNAHRDCTDVYGGCKLVMTLGAWGHADEILTEIAQEFMEYHPILFTEGNEENAVTFTK